MFDELQWRLVTIDEALDRLPMHCARWQSMCEDQRREVRIEWGTALRHIDHIQRNARGYRLHEYPDWFIMLQLRMEEIEPLLVYMELQVPY